jgi:COP9 signalosome complex subunit 7
MADVSKFTARLEPFLLMGKSAKGAAAAKLVQDATASPGVFVFGELLELEGVQELQRSENHTKVYELIKLFAYGTYTDWNGEFGHATLSWTILLTFGLISEMIYPA